MLFFVEYVADEVLTYEEVALLRPDPQRKRPVVLIGMLGQMASLKRSPFSLKNNRRRRFISPATKP